jgi:hypothetical protein
MREPKKPKESKLKKHLWVGAGSMLSDLKILCARYFCGSSWCHSGWAEADSVGVVWWAKATKFYEVDRDRLDG